MPPAWLIYEDAARKVLFDIRQVLGISIVECKQSLEGASSTNWEVDAKAWREGADGFLVIEVRQRKAALKQESLAAIAYVIKDVGGTGGIVISPLSMQKGAKLVATSANISHLLLSPESTAESYLAEYMGRRFIGVASSSSAHATSSCEAEIIRGGSNVT